MANLGKRWIHNLQFSSLFWYPPEDAQQRQVQITAYVEYFGQFTSDQFPEDIDELIRSHYPSKETRLLDEVLAMFVLHHPEHGDAVLLPIISCIMDGTLVYDKISPPFSSFISLVCQSSENEYSEQRALACGEILRVLTHYNRPIYMMDHQNREAERISNGSHATTSYSMKGKTCHSPLQQQETKPLRPMSPWITDILLATPLGIRSDYFRWSGGIMGNYAAGGELKPLTTACGSGSGKHPHVMTSTPRWAVANGAGVILSVCDEEVSHYKTATLTAAAVPALLLPPPTIALDEHLVTGMPSLEPYTQLFHRYYAIATPSATQRLLLGLLEAPPSWVPDALDAAVQLVELLRTAEDYQSGMSLPRNWMQMHFFHAIGTAMSMRSAMSADAAAAFLFRIISQPAILFPPLKQDEGLEFQNEPLGDNVPCYRKQSISYQIDPLMDLVKLSKLTAIYTNKFDQMEVPTTEATMEATAQGIASMFCSHGPEVEWRVCTIWEAAYGLIPLSSSVVDLPEIILASPPQVLILSWNLYLPLLRVLEHLPRGSPSEACLMRIFVATVEAIIRRTFLPQTSREKIRKSRYAFGIGSASKNLAMTELRKMVHSLFLESCASMDLASRMLFVVLTTCVSHKAWPSGSKKARCDIYPTYEVNDDCQTKHVQKEELKYEKIRKQGPLAAFDSYVLASVCALCCELELLPMNSKSSEHSDSKDAMSKVKLASLNGSSNELQNGMHSVIHHTRRILGILEALYSLNPPSVYNSWSNSTNETATEAMVAAHISELIGRSKACMHALTVFMQCKWDNEIYTRASSLYKLIDMHNKAVASTANKAEPLEAQLVHSPLWKDTTSTWCNCREHINCSNSRWCRPQQSLTLCCEGDKDSSTSITYNKCEESLLSSEGTENILRSIASLEMEASNAANFTTMDKHIRFDCGVQVILGSKPAEKQDLCFTVVSLLWKKLVAEPETQLREENISAQQGWRQVVNALCDVVSASPTKASAAIVLQAKEDLQSWIPRDDEQGQMMQIINQRIVILIVELMRNHDSPESLVILASASDLLLHATDGMLANGEACTLSQLELLEATARAVQLVLEWGDSAIIDGLSNLLKCRLPATTQCLSHPSAHIRALSMSVLQELLIGSIKSSSKHKDIKAIHGPPYRYSSVGVINWREDIEKCLTWEAHSQHDTQMKKTYLRDAAKELGCNIPI